MAQDKQLDKKNNREKIQPLSRRSFLLAGGAAALTVTLKGHENNAFVESNMPQEPAIPEDADARLKERFELAHNELQQACQAAADDLDKLANAYGIKDLMKLKKGVRIEVLPAHSNKTSSIKLTLRAAEEKTHTLKGIGQLVDACTSMDALYEERNRLNPDAAPEKQDYIKVIKQLADAYNAKGNMLTLSDDGQSFALRLLVNIRADMKKFERTDEALTSSESHQLDLKMTGPFDMGTFTVPVDLIARNPAMHTNRILADVSQRER